MKSVDCCHEDDVLDALTSDRWPDRVDKDLRAHVASCAICSDVVKVAGAILDGGDDDTAEMRIPSSAVMWWRAQMRARQEAAREASRPITVAQVIASVSAIAMTIALLVGLSPWLGAALSHGVEGARAAVVWSTSSASMPSTSIAQVWAIPALIIGVSLLLAPVAIYFAVVDD